MAPAEDLWALRVNEDDRLIFGPADLERQGEASFSVGQYEIGPNLIAALDSHRAGIENRSEGVYSGAQELSGPLGTAFYSRGRYTDGGISVEETCIFSLHPRESRILRVTYRYPAGADSTKRVEDLIGLFARVE